MMASDLFLGEVLASSYDLTTCSVDQLDLIEVQANDIISRIRETKKGALLIASLNTRHANGQFVRCTEQSVKTTALARYEPPQSDLNMSNLTIACFVGLITYLPLPAIKNVCANESATRAAEQLWENTPLDARWAIYYERLTSISPRWASIFLKEIQSYMDGSIIGHLNMTISDHVTVHSDSRTGNDSATSEETLPSSQNMNMLPPDQARSTPPLQNESLLLRVVKAKSSAWGSGHSTTVSSIVDLASFYVTQKRYKEARTILCKTFREWKKTQAEQSPEIHKLLTLLAEVDCQIDPE